LDGVWVVWGAGYVVRFNVVRESHLESDSKGCQRPNKNSEAEAAFQGHYSSDVIDEQPRSKALGQPPVVTLWHAWGVARGALNYVQRASDGVPQVS
jgi:hypothetical protein